MRDTVCGPWAVMIHLGDASAKYQIKASIIGSLLETRTFHIACNDEPSEA